MKEFWDERYAAEEYVYGKEANLFLQAQLADLSPGKALFAAEGEGRNAVFAATLGWDVIAFDISESAKVKADRLAKEKGVALDYRVGTLGQLDFEENSFDLVVLIFAHFPVSLRAEIHQKLVKLVKPGGIVILEAFSKKHLQFNSKNPKAGGPKDVSMLFSQSELEDDFKGLSQLVFEEKELYLEEGAYHVGQSAVIRLLGKK
ncbi:class I SAM-dependent methyltransferase [Algoriphagus hitonicola]|uniref:Methyltransferase domain-containing protein n=1 Tax=Algoriphagus hitonicola TaxID=435880 RepID=A0A1I2T2J5_9BACT|nr:class I SAM-dependent methyltransferase [Algoriphagus hitonicola]SFG59193.1 Methyltransferase domain-containing protein [Algoriphagus hitonicola]